MEAIIESGVKILEKAGNNPKDFMAKPKEAPMHDSIKQALVKP